jgi:FkbH-like protein
MRLRDRFGDNGVVGVAIAVPESTTDWRIDSFLLSCRVIGRQAETVLLSTLTRYALAGGCKKLVGEYIATAKNALVANFYASQGFQPMDNSGHYWALSPTTAPTSPPELFQVEYEQGSKHYG